MSGHFEQIGFAFESQEQVAAFMQRIAADCTPLPVTGGRYLRWSKSGIEIYIQLSDADGIIGLNPHFAGDARMKITAPTPVNRPDDSALDGAWHAWANPASDDAENGDYPFVFDSPDYLTADPVALVGPQQVQLAAFSHSLRSFADVESYLAGTKVDGKPGFADESFVPAGLFTQGGPPTAHAVFSGHVLSARKIENPLTRRSFHHLLVRTLGGQIDVVASTDVAPQEIDAGHVIQGEFWLSGRLNVSAAPPTPAQRQGFFKRLWNNG
jgi:hypothetical protein